MKKTIVFATLAGVFSASTVFASGWRVPEQSVNSTALSGAYVANTPGADTSYFNPAGMAWLEDRMVLEGDLTGIHLNAIDYTDSANAAQNGVSDSEDFLLPQLHLVSKAKNSFRFGFSLTYPAGLAKRWEDTYPQRTAQEFDLDLIEANPSASYAINERFSLACGVRLVNGDGVVQSYWLSAPNNPVSRSLDGDATEFGYNLALSYRASERLRLGASYRSEIDLDLKGKALVSTDINGVFYNGTASVSVPIPAVLTLGAALESGRTVVELVYDRTFWSAYKQLDFNYGTPITIPPFSAFDLPASKSWEDVSAFRIGLTHRLDDKLTLMAGFAMDENPVPDQTLGFEMPDSDARIYSVGGRYRCTEQVEVGLAYLYDDKESRTVNNAAANRPNGTFDNAAAHMVSLGVQYKF